MKETMRFVWPWLAAALLALVGPAGCHRSAEGEACDTDSDCQDGLECDPVERICEMPGTKYTDSGTPSDAAPGTDAAPGSDSGTTGSDSGTTGSDSAMCIPDGITCNPNGTGAPCCGGATCCTGPGGTMMPVCTMACTIG
ncbi:MAG TPA: hypothetical protein VG389_25485 [Myxococcota bacterium]|jgi:hypothetical protein|nr:hypothetical protein [Myxococcota bacterium]